MAKQTLVNQQPLTGAIAMFNIKATLKLAGWVVKSSSDGTTYNSTGDQITTGASGAGGMANNSAWFRIQDPGTRREFTIQRGTTNLVWRVKYSALAKFTGGTPGATQTPSATDEAILLGGGTDAAPTFATLFPTENTYRHHVIAMTTAEGNVYSFWSWTTINAVGTVGGTFVCDALGTTGVSASDQDPCILVCANATWTFSSWSTGSANAKGWYKFNLGGATFTPMHAHGGNDANANTGIPGNMGTNPNDAYEDGWLVPFGRNGTTGAVNSGPKGYSKFLRWKGSTRNYPDTINLATDAYVYVNDLLVPWENGTAPIL